MILPPTELYTFLPDNPVSPGSPISFTKPEDEMPIPKEKKPMPTDANDLSSISFEKISELGLGLLNTFSQDETSLIDDIAWDSNKVNEDAITLRLNQKKIPKDWNFIFMTMQSDALQTYVQEFKLQYH